MSNAPQFAAPALFVDGLAAPGPHPSLGAHQDTYGRLIGSWAGSLQNHIVAGSPATASIEIHFGWVLDGRAVQYVWITPARKDRSKGGNAPLDWYGTTLRVFEPRNDCWRALWWNPITGGRIDLEGRRHGDDIVQLGMRNGRPIRWTFSEIRRESFHWQGHILDVDGATWRLEVDILARRL